MTLALRPRLTARPVAPAPSQA
ncbi:MAG: hypothetical protein JWO25_358, partial [Alphaproteobacteria bacterium]|nr:hypothetical protein [Alphaproteobacteria bacterium]